MDYEQAVLHGSARRTLCILLAVGLIAGLFSGMFGIGGGTVIVPALVWIGLTQRQAAATSICAIIITSISGVISYAHGGDVDWIAALLLAVGIVCASPITLKVDKVLRRHKLLQGIFLAVLLVITIAYMVDATNSPFLYFRF